MVTKLNKGYSTIMNYVTFCYTSQNKPWHCLSLSSEDKLKLTCIYSTKSRTWGSQKQIIAGSREKEEEGQEKWQRKWSGGERRRGTLVNLEHQNVSLTKTSIYHI